MYGWNRGKPTGIRTADKCKPFHGMYRMCVCLQHMQDPLTDADFKCDWFVRWFDGSGMHEGSIKLVLAAAKERLQRAGIHKYIHTYINTYVTLYTTTSSLQWSCELRHYVGMCIKIRQRSNLHVCTACAQSAQPQPLTNHIVQAHCCTLCQVANWSWLVYIIIHSKSINSNWLQMFWPHRPQFCTYTVDEGLRRENVLQNQLLLIESATYTHTYLRTCSSRSVHHLPIYSPNH